MSNEIKDLTDKIAVGLALMEGGFLLAKQSASADAHVKFACIVAEPDGSGRIGATFEAEEFIGDLRKLLDLVNPEAS